MTDEPSEKRRNGLTRRGGLARKPLARGTSQPRRVPLQRRAPLRARFPPQPAQPGRREPSRKGKAVRPAPVPREWNPAELRDVVIARAEYRCDRCALYLPGRQFSIQHRRSRGAGGTAGHVLDTPANLILLCGSGVTGCHGRVETQERAEGYEHGFAIKGRVIDPAAHPIFRHLREWVIPSEGDGVGLWVPAEPLTA